MENEKFNETKNGKFAITSLILAVVGFIYGFLDKLLPEDIIIRFIIVGVGTLQSVIGLIFGIKGRKSEYKTIAIIGIILNSLQIIGAIVGIIFIIIFIASWRK
jgi:heme/copper-type cytochrome/quinol oxidase subunit 4